jgi:hypothetical protein
VIQNLQRQAEELATENQKSFLDALEASTKRLAELGRSNVDVILAFRTELGVSGDSSWFRCQMDAVANMALLESSTEISALREKLGFKKPGEGAAKPQ